MTVQGFSRWGEEAGGVRPVLPHASRVLRGLEFTDLYLEMQGGGTFQAGIVMTGATGRRPLNPAELPDGQRIMSEVHDLYDKLLVVSRDRVLQHGLSVHLEFGGVAYRATFFDVASGTRWQLAKALPEIPNIRQQRISASMIDAILQAVNAGHGGLILLVGPMRSGKTTGGYSLCQEILNSTGGSFYDLGDPYEMSMPGIEGLYSVMQRVVPDDQAWAVETDAALRSRATLLQTSEIRSHASARATVTLAGKGQPLVSTYHGGSIFQGLVNLARQISPDDVPAGFAELAEVLLAIIDVRLVADRGGVVALHGFGLVLPAVGDIHSPHGADEAAIRAIIRDGRIRELSGPVDQQSIQFGITDRSSLRLL